jgi:hypothetical protein
MPNPIKSLAYIEEYGPNFFAIFQALVNLMNNIRELRNRRMAWTKTRLKWMQKANVH